MFRVFLGAMFTYQVLYYSWLKLESIEKRQDDAGAFSSSCYLRLSFVLVACLYMLAVIFIVMFIPLHVSMQMRKHRM